MCYSQVTIKVTNRGETKDVWFVFETAHKSFQELTDQMIADGGLRGTRHETQPANGGADRQIVESYETFIDRTIICAVTELRSGLISKGGEVLV
jgi:hypothetical protein